MVFCAPCRFLALGSIAGQSQGQGRGDGVRQGRGDGVRQGCTCKICRLIFFCVFFFLSFRLLAVWYLCPIMHSQSRGGISVYLCTCALLCTHSPEVGPVTVTTEFAIYFCSPHRYSVHYIHVPCAIIHYNMAPQNGAEGSIELNGPSNVQRSYISG